MPNMTSVRGVCVLLSCIVIAGCGSYDKDFALAAAQAPGAGQIEGAWVGRWRSDTSGHAGDLKAIVTRINPSEYHVRYQAKYKALWTATFEHETTLRGHFAGSTFHFEGDADLGWLYGRYDYSGYVTDDEFFSTYKAKDDRGTYKLRRPNAPLAPADPPPATDAAQ